MRDPDEKRHLLAQFRDILRNNSLPLSVRLFFGLAFSFGLLWSLSIAASNFFSW